MKNTEFQGLIQEHIDNKSLVKLTLSDKADKKQEISKVLIKLVELKKGLHLSFVYRYTTKDITKNLEITQALEHIEALLATDFKQALLFTTKGDYHLTNKGKIKHSKGNRASKPSLLMIKTKNVL